MNVNHKSPGLCRAALRRGRPISLQPLLILISTPISHLRTPLQLQLKLYLPLPLSLNPFQNKTFNGVYRPIFKCPRIARVMKPLALATADSKESPCANPAQIAAE